MVKILFVKVLDEIDVFIVVLIICGDYELNEIKVEKLVEVVLLLEMVSEEEICVLIGVGFGLLGFVGLKLLFIVDCIVVVMNDFGVGVNIDGKYYFGINWGCDVELGKVEDLCNVVEGDLSLCGKGILMFKCGIEVGYIF